MRRRDDAGISAVIGAIVVLAVLGIALVSVNAYHVPKQGEGMEVAASERAEASLVELAATLSAPPEGPLSHDVPLKLPRGTPPLLAGVILTPARADGTLALEGAAAASNLTISVLVPAPATGVPANDPTRVAESGKMRVYLLGNATKGQPLGTLRALTGGSYLDASSTLLEGGAVVADTPAGSAAVAPPGLTLAHAGARTLVSWRVPLLAGAPTEVSGATASVALVPGPEAALGGGQEVDAVTLRVETPRMAAWQATLAALVGSKGTVVASGANDVGTVTATIPQAKLDLFLVRYDVALAQRAG